MRPGWGWGGGKKGGGGRKNLQNQPLGDDCTRPSLSVGALPCGAHAGGREGWLEGSWAALLRFRVGRSPAAAARPAGDSPMPSAVTEGLGVLVPTAGWGAGLGERWLCLGSATAPG